ncbi:hypothetical protein HMPREF0497_0253 [Lentilactobacillus buchneri ATCC 11577]|uniref:Uncharacterized protein n=1 Tax=Lentilactobacillus hilgardii (strain ATCC 8290 / DSM 20176 / CCUG 30140 / JCM 1155 / KCTC 3500 / NBRC 15886 / NCIMB 8040 / NRRL B-1843 / 9) TaxID=1423757 RepID=C0XIG6_LENH9|nr:hypothetical protein HMPREF0497_0253 [Lentilactobacillus buchneri ATCC 11577]EEI24821.1 hypothetical protein HMPREF0519_1027 [Lentilactobacillus hilgardii DSM 20176 = ATCC 8290]MCT3395214.1 hypothetical protein [Lentilactobacillus hilgardii]QEU39695.1 hypothetical protein LH500_12920 [Lentilactobacillus hilgardii]
MFQKNIWCLLSMSCKMFNNWSKLFSKIENNSREEINYNEQRKNDVTTYPAYLAGKWQTR